jgi:elongation of very long chain fatty acids protein 6
MYSYFALRAARVRVSRCLSQSITLLQLIQMIVGCTINLAARQYKYEGHECSTSSTNINLSLLLYASYFLLFAHFFYMTYVRRDTMKQAKKQN